jgi:hypothetical protein
MKPERLHTIEIEWSYPVKFSNRMNSTHINDECGIYYITRKYKSYPGKERNLYIGETKRSFAIRMNEHEADESQWTQAYGEKFVRFGVIKKLPKFDNDIDLKKFLTTIETAIIWEIDPEESDLVNIKQTKSAELAYNLHIINKGYRGQIPSDIYTK